MAQSAGGIRRNIRKSSWLCFSGKRRSGKTRDLQACTASCTSKPSSVSIILWSPIYTLQTSCALRQYVSCSAHVSNHSESEEAGNKLQHTTRSFLVCFFLWSPDKWSSTIHVRLTNTCVSLAKNLSSHVLSCAYFSRTSFYLCLLQ